MIGFNNFYALIKFFLLVTKHLLFDPAMIQSFDLPEEFFMHFLILLLCFFMREFLFSQPCDSEQKDKQTNLIKEIFMTSKT